MIGNKPMKKNNKKHTHIKVKDGSGIDFLCPAGSANKTGNPDLDLNVCFEKNVPGRYAARITIRES